MTIAPDNQETGISGWAFALAALLVVIVAMAVVWFMFPAPDTRHDLVSPSGQLRIELGELCTDGPCRRVAILDQAGIRTGCPLDIPGEQPLFQRVSAQWAADESRLTLAYESQDGSSGNLDIDLADCILTE